MSSARINLFPNPNLRPESNLNPNSDPTSSPSIAVSWPCPQRVPMLTRCVTLSGDAAAAAAEASKVAAERGGDSAAQAAAAAAMSNAPVEGAHGGKQYDAMQAALGASEEKLKAAQDEIDQLLVELGGLPTATRGLSPSLKA